MIAAVQRGALTFNSDNHHAITTAEGLGLPPIRTSSFNLAGEHFGRHVSSFYGARRFALGGVVIGDSIADFVERRAALFAAFDILSGPQPITFTLADGRVLALDAVTLALDFAPRAGWPTAAEFQIELEAAFPFFTAADPTTITLTLPTGGGGTVPADTMPLGLSMGSGGTITTINPGTTPSYPTLRVNGPIINPAIRNVTTGKELRLTLTLASGEYLDIDTLLKELTDSAGTNRYASKTGDWLTVAPGSNTFALVADSYDPGASVTLEYRPTYPAI